MYRLLLSLFISAFFWTSCLGQQPDITVNGCEINGRVYQDRTVRPPTYLGLPVYLNNGIYVDLPGLGLNYPCYRATPTGSSCRLCLNKTIFGTCYSYSSTIGNIYTFSYSELNCPLDHYVWVLGLVVGMYTVLRLCRNR